MASGPMKSERPEQLGTKDADHFVHDRGDLARRRMKEIETKCHGDNDELLSLVLATLEVVTTGVAAVGNSAGGSYNED